MAIVNRGFVGRPDRSGVKLPPGQYRTFDFPVLSAEPTPDIALSDWRLTVQPTGGPLRSYRWDDFTALPHTDITTDIHCVTRWSKFDTRWRGVSMDVVLDGMVDTDTDTSAEQGYLMAHCYGGYTTNLPIRDLLHGQAWLVDTYDGEPLAAEHGGPVRLLVPHLYFWKSAKWVRRLRLMPGDTPGFWESHGYHMYGDPWLEQRYS
ncbi:sulfite oxidase-like oxidoreductase [Gordonia jinhuaensis]|nr:molybdopterin-dependent oxidoreductase [Gordonia jinhuaensis]